MSTPPEFDGLATALSIDQWYATPESKCEYDEPSLSVNFVCCQPPIDELDIDALDGGSTPRDADPPNKATAARFQEIFVDLIGLQYATMEAASPSHFLDERFDSFLVEGEREFKDSLMEFLAKQTPRTKETRAYTYLENMLRSEMGYRNTYFWASRMKYSRERSRDQHAQNSWWTSMLHRNYDTAEQAQSSSSTFPVDDPGHVFVCNSSVCDLQCDAFLCPASISKDKGGITGSVLQQWIKGTLHANDVLLDNIQEVPFIFKTYEECDRVVTLKQWPWAELASTNSQIPFVVFGEVSLEESQLFAAMPKGTQRSRLPSQENHIQALMETVRQFLEVAVEELQVHQKKPRCYRQRFVLALPILGTGGGFAGDLMGHVVEELLFLLTE